jgi:hypothetical protein
MAALEMFSDAAMNVASDRRRHRRRDDGMAPLSPLHSRETGVTFNVSFFSPRVIVM